MRALAAIVKQTIRASVRSRVFLVLFILILLAVFLLPITVSGDGSAMGQVQISLTYSLGVVVTLISTSTLWLSCAVLAREIEAYNMHLVMSKPCPGWIVWLGKWLGVFLMQGAMLVVAGLIILGLVSWRMREGSFPEDELARVNNEVLVGRRVFRPQQPDFLQMARAEYQRRLKEGSLDSGHNPKLIMDELYRQVKAKSAEVPPGATRFWMFKNVRLRGPDEPVYFHYRHYLGSTSRSAQKITRGRWVFRDPKSGQFFAWPQSAMSGRFHELPLRGTLIDSEGSLVIGYENLEAGDKSIMFQHADGPTLLVRVTGFVPNYLRSMVLALFQLAFLAALGCMLGAAFSTPVAVFVALMYLVIGMSVQGAVSAPIKNEMGQYEYTGVVDRVCHYIALVTNQVVVSVDDFDATSDLARGRLIEWGRLVAAFLGMVALRGGGMAALGMYVLTRRELGLAIRR